MIADGFQLRDVGEIGVSETCQPNPTLDRSSISRFHYCSSCWGRRTVISVPNPTPREFLKPPMAFFSTESYIIAFRDTWRYVAPMICYSMNLPGYE